MLLSKKFRFEAAHRLAKGYVGKCAHIHGHSWHGELQLQCKDLDPMGMGLDFKEIKAFNQEIVHYFDHKILLFEEDLDIIELCKKNNYLYVTFDNNPTSECIAQYIFNKARDFFKKNHPQISVHQVVIEETCTSKCVWHA